MRLSLRAYYAAKPFLPKRLRSSMRRFHARRIREQSRHTWPIRPGSEIPPPGWVGWPNGKKFAVVLTHDVEANSGYDRVPRLAALEMEEGFRSSFNFIPEGGYRVAPELRAQLAADGFEVGVHDLYHDGNLYKSRETFSRHAKRINLYVREWNAAGFRSGFMQHNLEWLSELDVAYDASTFDTDPFEPQPDGVGTIFPFWVPHPTPSGSISVSGQTNGKHDATAASNGRRTGFVELPYTLVQDSTLFLYLGEKDIDCWKRKVDWIAEHGGMVLLNVHPDYLNFEGRFGDHDFPVDLYRELLVYIRERYGNACWQALPREVAAFVAPAGKTSTRDEVGYLQAGSSTRTFAHRDVPTEEPKPLAGRRAAVVLYSSFPSDPRPRRAAEALRDAGMEVDIICLRDKDAPGWEVENSIRVRRLPITRLRGGKLAYLWRYASFIVSAAAWLAWRTPARRYDLVHVHNMPDVLVFSALIPKLFGARILLDLHDPMPELMMTIFGGGPQSRSVRLLKRIEKWSMAFSHHVITVNLACKKIFAARSCASEKVQVIMNSPDERIFGKSPRPPKEVSRRDPGTPFKVMCHGSIVERHGADLGVLAVSQLCTTIPNIEFRIVGPRTPFVDEVLALARAKGVEHCVRFCGGMSTEQIVVAIDECDLGIVPNRRSVFTELNTPTRIFEYLSRGVPVISPRAPGIQDYFGERDMVYFELGDATDLARQIRYVYEHPEEVAAIVRRGQVVYRNHQWHAERRRLVDLAASLVGKVAARSH